MLWVTQMLCYGIPFHCFVETVSPFNTFVLDEVSCVNTLMLVPGLGLWGEVCVVFFLFVLSGLFICLFNLTVLV